MKCPSCGSSDTCRSRRNALDTVWTWLNRWPYQCRGCLRRFHGNSRYPTAASQKQRAAHNKQRTNTAPPPAISGKIEVRTHPNEPIAGIVVQAESQSELNSILLTLNQALASYGPTNKPQPAREKVRQ